MRRWKSSSLSSCRRAEGSLLLSSLSSFVFITRIRRLGRGRAMAGEEFGADRQLVGSETERLAGDRLGDAVQFEQDVAWADGGHPVFGLAFAFTHSGFRRAGGDR